MSVVNPAFGDSIYSWTYIYPQVPHLYPEEHPPDVVREKRLNSVSEIIDEIKASLCERAGFVVATDVESFTGPYLYSDYAFYISASTTQGREQTTILNEISKAPFIGILAAITRIALAIVHIIVHSIQGLVSQEKGHFYHAAKGVCEIYRGLIDAIPIFGRIYSVCKYSSISGDTDNRGILDHWTIMKIYNPNKPDLVDEVNNFWRDPKPNIITFRA